jgi:hypothetical protein
MKTIINYIGIVFFGSILLGSCGEKDLADNVANNVAEITQLTDEQYPDNNDIETRSELWNVYEHAKVEVIRNSEKDFTIVFLPTNDKSDTIFIEHINLLAWIPTIPTHAAKDEYLEHIGIINAEWNRQQVRFDKGTFRVSTDNEEGAKTVRIDLARNCLNAYAWEIITYTEEAEKQKSMYHGWFDFPKAMYRELFDEVNKGLLTFAEYKDHLEGYTHPRKEVVNLEVLRTVDNEYDVEFEDFKSEFYPMTGARKSKYKNIVYPENPTSIKQMLNDSTCYSTFQWPGRYDTKDPRPSTLSMLGIPKRVIIRETTSNNTAKEKCYEFDVTYARNTDTAYLTRIVIGGVRKSDLKQLDLMDYNGGFKMPMGIGNHPFYEKQEKAQENTSRENPYYGLVIDAEGKWVDSHFLGVDGPLFHMDIDDENVLHYWILSFERHAMVAHLTFNLDKPLVVVDTSLESDMKE